MSFPRYPKYKDSGVEWLGEVPEHWGGTALKRFVDPSRPITYGIVQAGPDIVGGVPYIRPADMTDEQGVAAPDGLLRTSAEIATAYTRSTIQPGDLVCSIGPSFGKVMVTPAWLAGANLTQGTARVAVQKGQHPRYVFWALRSGVSVAQWESSVGGATFRALNLGPLAETMLPVPPLPEQQAIAAFLDRETAKIDSLIGEQQRLIELLQEKRQAVISHAVTKGLNPDAPMKDSGIEWLGVVPQHWKCVRNKVVFHEVDDRSETEDGELLTVSHITGVTPRSEKDVNMFMAETFVGYKKCRAGDLVINTMWAWMGALGCARCDGIVSPSYNVYRPRDHQVLWPDYYDDLCRVPSHRIAIKARSTGIWESRLRLYPDAFLGMSMPLPPFGEQQEIAAFVDRQTSQWDSLTAEAERAIALLQERRSALISAAVTGQIDVRGLAGSEAA
jgi:type I restriction enzyme S subunit